MQTTLDKQIDDLGDKIQTVANILAEKEQTIKKLEKKIQELQEVCFEYSQGVYELLGEFSDESVLTPFERLSLKRLKATIDKNLANDNYKNYLTAKYIDINSEAHAKLVALANQKIRDLENTAASINNAFVETTLNETVPEDDTETLIIKEDK